MIGADPAVAKARLLLDEGQVVGIPTETVYGLAARIDIPSAIEKIFTTKERPFFDPLIVHVSSIEQAKRVVAYWSPSFQVLAEAFWPGPLTLVLPKDPSVNSMITSGLETVGVRMPRHPMALQLLKLVGVPLAAPSANKFGQTSPTQADHVRSEFQKEDVFVLDGGDCEVGIESTVLAVQDKSDRVLLSVLRKGQILESDIAKVFEEKGYRFEFSEVTDKKQAPGHMKHHYMPAVPLIVCQNLRRSWEDLRSEVSEKMKHLPDEVEGIKLKKAVQGLQAVSILKLSTSPSLAAREFYAKLREAAATGADCILFYHEEHQRGEAWEPLLDRLNKAASLRL